MVLEGLDNTSLFLSWIFGNTDIYPVSICLWFSIIVDSSLIICRILWGIVLGLKVGQVTLVVYVIILFFPIHETSFEFSSITGNAVIRQVFEAYYQGQLLPSLEPVFLSLLANSAIIGDCLRSWYNGGDHPCNNNWPRFRKRRRRCVLLRSGTPSCIPSTAGITRLWRYNGGNDLSAKKPSHFCWILCLALPCVDGQAYWCLSSPSWYLRHC